MNSPNHILILTPGFPKDENDFNCIPPLQEFLLKLHSIYPSTVISVIAFQYPFQSELYCWNGININPLDGKNTKLKKPFVWSKAIRKAKKVHKAIPVDVVHSLWLGECAMVGNILSKRFGCKHICTLMGQDVKANNGYLRFAKSEKTNFIALSKNQAQEFTKLTNRKADEIIHWGIEDQNYEKVDRGIDLLAVGSLIPLKNYSLFITLVGELKTDNPKIKCKLVGSGPELASLKKLSIEKGVSENIEFTGLLSRHEIFKLMQKSKIFVHPSKFEGFGYVFAEALVNGMSIVSYNVGYAQNHPKWFIAKDEQDFMNIIKRLLVSKLDFEPVNLFPLQETVDRYAALYEISSI
ncbi:MAG: glycosyltransferase family 4 protein [Ignavibacteria bacterium]|nr:glycosyltransferase family 4 protein [Ignavibacteria bacterium]